jgi:hypothetical protein
VLRLRDWALGVTRKLTDAESSLAFDDIDFLPEYARGMVAVERSAPTAVKSLAPILDRQRALQEIANIQRLVTRLLGSVSSW